MFSIREEEIKQREKVAGKILGGEMFINGELIGIEAEVSHYKEQEEERRRLMEGSLNPTAMRARIERMAMEDELRFWEKCFLTALGVNATVDSASEIANASVTLRAFFKRRQEEEWK